MEKVVFVQALDENSENIYSISITEKWFRRKDILAVGLRKLFVEVQKSGKTVKNVKVFEQIKD